MKRNASVSLALLALSAQLALSGCLAKTAASVVTAPIKVASKGVDLATTSQSEADENRGKKLRKLEDRYEKELKMCREGDQRACDDAKMTYNDIQQMLPAAPSEPETQR